MPWLQRMDVMNCTFLRYHPYFNPIEMVWRNVKIEQHKNACLKIWRKSKSNAKKYLLNTKRKIAKLLLPPEENRRGTLVVRWFNVWSNREHDYSLTKEFRLYEYRWRRILEFVWRQMNRKIVQFLFSFYLSYIFFQLSYFVYFCESIFLSAFLDFWTQLSVS
jgi:hypothetical protein